MRKRLLDRMQLSVSVFGPSFVPLWNLVEIGDKTFQVALFGDVEKPQGSSIRYVSPPVSFHSMPDSVRISKTGIIL